MSKLKKRGVGHKAILALLSGVKETENSGIDVKIVKPYPLDKTKVYPSKIDLFGLRNG